jgi:hypothetical protein
VSTGWFGILRSRIRDSGFRLEIYDFEIIGEETGNSYDKREDRIQEHAIAVIPSGARNLALV